jgi:hypothetical protein
VVSLATGVRGLPGSPPPDRRHAWWGDHPPEAFGTTMGGSRPRDPIPRAGDARVARRRTSTTYCRSDLRDGAQPDVLMRPLDSRAKLLTRDTDVGEDRARALG